MNTLSTLSRYPQPCYYIPHNNFKLLVFNNRTCHRSIYHAIRTSRAGFTYALRQCKLDERLIVSEKLADQMKDHEINFKKHSKSKSAPSDCIELRKK